MSFLVIILAVWDNALVYTSYFMLYFHFRDGLICVCMHRADDYSSDFALMGIEADCIHGGREQCDREAALDYFRNGDVKILIATDVASRGLDICDIRLVDHRTTDCLLLGQS